MADGDGVEAIAPLAPSTNELFLETVAEML